MFTITAEELNKLVYPKSCEGRELEHTEKYKKLRNRYTDLSEEQFAQLYRDFIGTSGTIGYNGLFYFHYDEKEAEMISDFINDYIGSEFASFTDMWNVFAADCRKNAAIVAWGSRDHFRKALYAICDDGLCPEIECFKVKICGKTHIRMFRKKTN